MSIACSEIVWLCGLLAELSFPQSNSTPLHADNILVPFKLLLILFTMSVPSILK
jgi:hypothetical protein